MRKIFYIIAALLEAALLAGAYIVHYFTRKKMGMLRYVIYKNQNWERDYPIAMLRITVLSVLLVLTVIAVLLIVRRRKTARKLQLFETAAAVVLVALYIGFTLGSSVEDFRAYYFMSGLLSLAASLQIIKTYITLLVHRHEK